MSFSMGFIPAPAHLSTYSTLLGTELYQSFVMTKLAYQALPRSAFTTLQKRVFPIYFQSQSLLVLLVAATMPPYRPASLIEHKRVWIPFAVAGLNAGLNLLIYGPQSHRLMVNRVHQDMWLLVCDASLWLATRATRDAKLQLGDGMSEDMKKPNMSFSRAHAMSIHLKLFTIGATLWYGWQLAGEVEG